MDTTEPVVKPKPTEVLDGLKRPVPKKLLEVFAARSQFQDLQTRLNKISAEAKELAGTVAGSYIHLQSVQSDIESAKNGIRGNVPYTTCPKCKAGKSGCETCKGRGFVTKAVYGNVPPEFKGAAK